MKDYVVECCMDERLRGGVLHGCIYDCEDEPTGKEKYMLRTLQYVCSQF